MNDSIRVLVAVTAAVLVVALISYARGHDHHHGIYVGSLGTSSEVAAQMASARPDPTAAAP